jgi:hypothetical protein
MEKTDIATAVPAELTTSQVQEAVEGVALLAK